MHNTRIFSRFFRIFALCAAFAAPFIGAHEASAVGTRTFTLDTLDKLSGGDLKGVSIGSDGAVRAGFSLGAVPLADATAVWSAITLADGSTLVGTSPNGKVYKLTGEQSSVFADTGSLAVTSIVQAANGTIYAGTIPDGKIFKLSQGKADLFATLEGASHVWALTLDKAKTGLFAATGPDGKIFRVEPNGTSSVYYKSDEPHLVSLAINDAGELYAGSSGKGILYKVSGPGRATVLYDFPGEEVKGVAVTKNGVVYAIANEYGEAPEPPKRAPYAGRTQSGPTSGTRPKPGKGVLYRFDSAGRPEKMMGHNEFHYTALALDDHGVPYVGTGAEGRVYMVDDGHVVSLVADTDERQVGALSVAQGHAFVGSSDPAVFHRVIGQGGADAVWTSKALDAGLRARFGTLTWRATGALEVSTRSGNTQTPDATWSAWSNSLAAPGAVTSPAARFVQVRARWSRDPRAVLSEVELPFVTDNLRPVLLEVSAQQKGGISHDSKETIPPSGGEIPKHETVVKVSWKVDNPDNDSLRYRLSFRRDAQNLWRDVLRSDEVISKTEYDWDTIALPEGKYRVRVEASDEPANPPDQVQRHQLESEPFIVDHTPPVIQSITIQNRRLRVRVTDGVGPIARVEIAVDGKPDWRPLGPADGVFDTADESVDADVSTLVPAGAHLVTVRAYDAAGNVVSRETDAN